MAEPVGFAASIITLLQLTKDVLEYLKEAHNASHERSKLSAEIESTQNLLAQLTLKSEEAKWGDSMKVLATPRGPLNRLESTLKGLEQRLKSSDGRVKALGKALKWPFDKKETEAMIASLERSKSLLTLALQRDLLYNPFGHVANCCRLTQGIADDLQSHGQQLSNLERGQKCILLSHATCQRTAGLMVDQVDHIESQKDREIMGWLSSLNFWLKQNDIFERSCEGTGKWLLNDPEFQKWIEGETPVLWCPGDRTYAPSLCCANLSQRVLERQYWRTDLTDVTYCRSIVINHLEKTFLLLRDVRIVFIYFNHKEDPSAVDLLASLLKQILQQGTAISAAVRDLYAKHESRDTRPTLAEISDLLVAESQAVSKVYMVVDALDECPAESNTKDEVLAALRRLPNLHLLVTSRPHMDISQNFNVVWLPIKADDGDIAAFIRSRLEKNQYLKRYVKEDFKEALINKVINKADGM